MGFGFVVARFGLFLRELAMTGVSPSQPGHALSIPFGIALITLGILVTAVATVRHRNFVRALQLGAFAVEIDSRFPLVVAALLVIVGTIMAAYLALI